MEVDETIEEAWAHVLAEWADPKAHRAFVTLCASTDRLGEAGRRYRAIREHDPARAAEAKEQIDRILGMAMQSLSALKTPYEPRSAKTKMFLVALGMSGAIVATAVITLLRFL